MAAVKNASDFMAHAASPLKVPIDDREMQEVISYIYSLRSRIFSLFQGNWVETASKQYSGTAKSLATLTG